jgi:hypothetical protein
MGAAMTQIDPFAGSIVQSTQVQRTQAADKDQQVRKNEDRAKDAGLGGGDTFEHQVESTDAPQPINHDDEQDARRNPSQQQRRGTRRPAAPTAPADADADPPPHVDLTA